MTNWVKNTRMHPAPPHPRHLKLPLRCPLPPLRNPPQKTQSPLAQVCRSESPLRAQELPPLPPKATAAAAQAAVQPRGLWILCTPAPRRWGAVLVRQG